MSMVLEVRGMSCGHCVAAITSAVTEAIEEAGYAVASGASSSAGAV